MVPLWVYEDVGRDCSTLRVYLTILTRNLKDRNAPRRLDWLISTSGVSRSTVYEALASLRETGALVETDDEWTLPLDRPSSDQSDESSDLADRSSGRSDDTLLSIEDLDNPEGSSTDVDLGFDHFWSAWPLRNGKRLGKAKAVAVWRRLSIDERRAAWRGAVNYAAASNAGLAGAMDAFRWLRDRLWVEWQTPATPDRSSSRGGPAVMRGALDLAREEWENDHATG